MAGSRERFFGPRAVRISATGRIVTPDVQEIALPDLATTAGQEAYDAILGDAELIVIDNLSALSRTGPENEGESWLPIASWALRLRRQGRAVLFVHHEGKNGQQRGSSRREDLLDVVLALLRPSDYQEQQGARFTIVFKKFRGLHGSDVDNVEAQLATDSTGAPQWRWKDGAAAGDSRILELLQLGMSSTDVATEIGVNRSTVFRARKRLEAAGQLKQIPGNVQACHGLRNGGMQRDIQRRDKLLHVLHRLGNGTVQQIAGRDGGKRNRIAFNGAGENARQHYQLQLPQAPPPQQGPKMASPLARVVQA